MSAKRLMIRRDGWLVWWACYMPDWLAYRCAKGFWPLVEPPQSTTSLCELFWTLAVWTPFAVALSIPVAALFVPIYWIVRGIARLFRILMPPGRANAWADRLDARWDSMESSRLLAAMLRAKRRVCPLVEIVEREDR
jgi:hypothetical protein